ncbi:MAG TPA: short-chain dehydrogenase, partial [Hyphomonas sp.]|nr:short-chain dehydrogenase [Hyphomonas sp.]
AAITLQADLSDETATGDLILHAAEKIGQPVTLLVNSASVFEEDSVTSHTRASWDMHMNANLRAPV